MSKHSILIKGIESLGIKYSAGQIAKIETLLTELTRWNKRFNLVKARGDNLIINHLLDSLTGIQPIRKIKNRDQIIDIGSGAGFPGIPLSIFLTSSRFTLCERSAIRASFLKNMVLLLKLGNIEVEQKELKNINKKYDIAVFRALGNITRYIKQIVKLVKEDGIVLAYKGKFDILQQEVEMLKNEYGQIIIQKTSVPFLNKQRHFLILCNKRAHSL